jgi:small nuclear ribonucleoprotein
LTVPAFIYLGLVSPGEGVFNVSQRPLDVLDAAKGDQVLVKLKARGDEEEPTMVSGELKAFDLHLNMWLEDATMENASSQEQYGKLLVRGDNVMVVSPE